MMTSSKTSTLHGFGRLGPLLLGSAWLVCAGQVSGTPLDIPGNQTFDALAASLESYENAPLSKAVGESVAEARRLIDRGRLLLIAGRMRASAILAERARIQLEIISLQVTIEMLRDELDAETEKKREKETALSSMKAKLDAWHSKMKKTSDGAAE